MTIESILEEFKEKSSLYINGSLSPLIFDNWLHITLIKYRNSVIDECMQSMSKDMYKGSYHGTNESSTVSGDLGVEFFQASDVFENMNKFKEREQSDT